MTATGAHTNADPYRYRPDLDPANTGVPSWVYLVHLDPAYRQAEHYTGSAHDLAARMADHGTERGARLLQVQREAGGSWHIARTWPGGWPEERAIEDWKQAPRLCPDCTPGTGRGAQADVARAAGRIRAAQTRPYAAEPNIEPDGDEVLLSRAARRREDVAPVPVAVARRQRRRARAGRGCMADPLLRGRAHPRSRHRAGRSRRGHHRNPGAAARIRADAHSARWPTAGRNRNEHGHGAR
jgi:hypothetical protein